MGYITKTTTVTDTDMTSCPPNSDPNPDLTKNESMAVRHILSNSMPINTTCRIVNSPVPIRPKNSNKNNSIDSETSPITEIINQERDHGTVM